MKPVSLVRGVMVCLFSLLSVAAYSQQPAEAHSQIFPKVTIPGSQVRPMKSTSTGRDYDLYIHLPSTYEQGKGKKYPALYILDGQWDFKLMDSVLGGLVYDKVVPEIILVGISYSGENADYNALRAMDYIPAADPWIKGSGDGPKFLKFLKTELVPFIESNYDADPSHRLLQGSSLGGLFTLYAMLTEPTYFSGYVAASPAVPVGKRYLFQQEAEYANSHKDLSGRLYLAVGSIEELAGPVQEFMRTLQSRGYKGLKLETRVVDGERHAGNKPEIYNRGLRFLFSE